MYPNDDEECGPTEFELELLRAGIDPDAYLDALDEEIDDGD